MTRFKDTSKWTKKDGNTLVYSYKHDGKVREGSSERNPKTIYLQLERLTVHNETSWQMKDEKEPDSETGFSDSEYISAIGTTEDRIHAITLDDNENAMMQRLDVNIYPMPLEELQKTSTIEDFAAIFLDDEDKPEDGWLNTEHGRIDYHGEGEYHHEAMFYARLFLSTEKFDELVRNVKVGGITHAQIQILADFFELSYEGVGAGMAGHYYNYAILCEDEGDSPFGTAKGAGGYTKARLQELRLSWSPKLEKPVHRENPIEDDELDLGGELSESDMGRAVASLVEDVRGIRVRLASFYRAAVFVAVIYIVSQLFNWFISI